MLFYIILLLFEIEFLDLKVHFLLFKRKFYIDFNVNVKVLSRHVTIKVLDRAPICDISIKVLVFFYIIFQVIKSMQDYGFDQNDYNVNRDTSWIRREISDFWSLPIEWQFMFLTIYAYLILHIGACIHALWMLVVAGMKGEAIVRPFMLLMIAIAFGPLYFVFIEIRSLTAKQSQS